MVSFSKIFILVGGVFILIGAGVFFLQKFNFPFGRLPGDIIVKGEKFSFYFPITSCVLIGVILSVMFWLSRKSFLIVNTEAVK